jgi:chorismate mutase
VAGNTRADILLATSELLVEMVRRNDFQPHQIVAALFTLTPDLNAAFPAAAARAMGWTDVPLMCAQEIPVPDALPSIVRVLLLVEGTETAQHVYLGAARPLRPDLAENTTEVQP